MHVDRVLFDGFEPMTHQPPHSAADPDVFGPAGGSVSLISQNGRLRVLMHVPQRDPKQALIAAVRQLLRMPEYRGGAQRLTFARKLRLCSRPPR